MHLAGVLHDIGKIGVSDRLIRSPGRSTRTSGEQIRTHPEIGARLSSHPEFEDLRGWVLAHHERPDGKGYPHGLEGDEIPLEAQHPRRGRRLRGDDIPERPYRSSLTDGGGRRRARAGVGTQFDAQCGRGVPRRAGSQHTPVIPQAS